MLVLNALKKSFKPLPFLYLLIIFSFISFFPSFFVSLNFSGEKVDGLNLLLNYIRNEGFFGGVSKIIELLDLSNFNIKDFFSSSIGFLFFLTFFSFFVIFHLFLPFIYKKINSEKSPIFSKNSFFVLLAGVVQILIYGLLFYLYIFVNSYLNPFFESLILETYKIVLEVLKDIIFLFFALLLRYFFSFLKVFLSFEDFSFSHLKNSLSLCFKNYFKLLIFHLLLFGINYFFLQLLGGNFLNVLLKTYFLQLSLSYYLVLKENK